MNIRLCMYIIQYCVVHLFSKMNMRYYIKQYYIAPSAAPSTVPTAAPSPFPTAVPNTRIRKAQGMKHDVV